MVIAASLGFPRIGPDRELKRGLENFWAGKIDEAALAGIAGELKRRNWTLQKDSGIVHVPSNDFSFYDHVLDTIAMLGAVPSRFGWSGDLVDLDTYFAMARGGRSAPPMEMTKWFDTNYHYMVPEFERNMEFRLSSTKALDEFKGAMAIGVETRPVLLGPVSFLLLGKSAKNGIDPLILVDAVTGVYEYLLKLLAKEGAAWVQIDEPCLATDLNDEEKAAYKRVYEKLSSSETGVNVLIGTYFGGLGENLPLAMSLPVSGLHLDLARDPEQLDGALAAIPEFFSLSLGLVDGRNVWRTDINRAIGMAERVLEHIWPHRIHVAPSCSLMHVPYDVDLETGLDVELLSWMAFAKQKMEEVSIIARGITEGRGAIEEELKENGRMLESRRVSGRIHNAEVRKRLSSVTEDMLRRGSPYEKRRELQEKRFNLPPLPTTTIGSFPQTPDVRKARAAARSGKIDAQAYREFMRGKIADAIRAQEEMGLDVLVHGEFERADMVEYFGENMAGFAFTENGWVQSYGSRCVKPPVIYGDVYRERTITVEWIEYAKSLTQKPVKGMLTGPVTMLQWSFVRNDQPRRETCRQIALAMRDEAGDLERSGVEMIQIDEPALREGLPLRRSAWNDYLKWAVDAFRLASSGVADETQIHTHMCYAEFGSIMDAIAAMDADVISIESSRSRMELLDVFRSYRYPNEIGPGIYDVHSPTIPTKEEMEELLHKAVTVVPPKRLWVNPDCGLKTRRWEEVRPSLTNMVKAAKALRSAL